MFQLGEWLVDPTTRRLGRDAEVARLSPKAMAVLQALHKAGGRVVKREALLEKVWPNVTVGEEVLTHAVAELRKALGDSRRQPRYIETVHKAGYRLMVEVPWPAVSTGLLDLENHARYLEGCELFFRGGHRNVSRAVDVFSGIMRHDGGHARAHAGLAKSLFFLDKYFGLGGDNRAYVERLARRAVALDGRSPDAHAALGLALTGSGKYQEALASFAMSVKLNPHLAESHYLLGRASFAQGEYRMAAIMLERAAQLRSDDFHSLMLAAKARRVLKEHAQDRADLIEASKRLDRWLEIAPDDRRAQCDKICCMVELGETQRGIEIAAALADDRDANHYYLVCGLARAGETDLALDCFETVTEAGWSHGAWLAHDHDVDSLRREPTFKRLAAHMPLP